MQSAIPCNHFLDFSPGNYMLRLGELVYDSKPQHVIAGRQIKKLVAGKGRLHHFGKRLRVELRADRTASRANWLALNRKRPDDAADLSVFQSVLFLIEGNHVWIYGETHTYFVVRLV